MDKEYLQNELERLLKNKVYYQESPRTVFAKVNSDVLIRIDAQIDLILLIANDFGIEFSLLRRCF